MSQYLGYVENVFKLLAVVILIAGSVNLGIFCFLNFRLIEAKIIQKKLGETILVSLEFLIISDVIRSIVIEPNLNNVIVLGVILLIRTFLSFELQMKLERKFLSKRKKKN